MKRLIRTALLSASLLLFLLSSCDRRPLEIYYPDAARIRIDVDWESRFGSVPSGMTMLFFQNGDTLPQTVVTNSTQSTYVDLKPGVYHLVLFNQSYDEFGSFRFENTTSYRWITTRARNIVTRQNQQWDEGTVYMADPERFAVALDTFTITEDMLEEQVRFTDYRNRARASLGTDTAVYVIQETAFPMTTVINVHCHVLGINNMRSVEANITGLADGCRMQQIWRTPWTGTLLLDGWNASGITRAATDSITEGWLHCSMPTWGLPHGKELVREPEDNLLRLCFLMKDGTTREYQYNVGHLIHYRNAEFMEQGYFRPSDVALELELVLDVPIRLPEVIDTGAGGGFSAEVDDWEDGGTIEIEF